MDDEKIVLEIDESDLYEEKEEKAKRRVLSFALSNEKFCVDIDHVKEVVKLGNITMIPNTPDFIVGAINLRGEIITLADIRVFLGLSGNKTDSASRVLVTDVLGNPMGVLLDKMSGILNIEEEAIQPPLATITEKSREYTTGQAKLGEEIFTLLDLKKVLKNTEQKGGKYDSN